MPAAGLIFALDLATSTGFAAGEASAVPTSGTVILKERGEPAAVAFSNLLMFLVERWTADRPAVVVKEAPLPLQAYRTLGNAAATVRFTYGLHAVVELACVRFGLPPCHDVVDSTARKHFLGVGRLGDRKETKAAVVQRCHLLRLMPADVHDDNRADALAVWDWAAAHLARRPPAVLHMFGEGALA